MPEFASSKTLLRVSTAKKSRIDGWKEGRHLETNSGRDLPSLVERATSDRLLFAAAILRDAETLATRNPPQYRASISRSYYAMYHAMRAAVYFAHGGDDHQEHKALPAQAPADMTARDDWSNKLKDARERRNAADYDPYPKSDTAWRKRAEALIPEARGLIREVRANTSRTAIWIASKIADAVFAATKEEIKYRYSHESAAKLRSNLEQLLGMEEVESTRVHRLIPEVHSVVQRFGEGSGKRVYIFLDDIHYVPRSSQPELLDILHSFVRDSDAWLKVAMIRHFSKWFHVDPPTGLQAGQDADAIDLDLTLQQPAKAKQFLETVLLAFARHFGIPSLMGLYATEALDRLVLASGAVPRDYLVLAAEALGHARSRGKGRLVGKQDVVRAAGDIAQKKLAELDEDATSSTGSAQHMLAGLQVLREFCLDEKKATYFQVDFKEKERLSEEYSLLQSLMDVRLVHLVNSSVSDTHRSGVRSEAYILDLSQFSGERFKKYLKVLDFESGHIVLRETGRRKAPRLGDTPRKLITILRGAPEFSLARFSPALM